jgi:hypothetical protein
MSDREFANFALISGLAIRAGIINEEPGIAL